jgi:hypothetical protein
MVRVLVCGGRDYRDPNALKGVLDGFHAVKPITVIIEGGASGADCYAAEWSDENQTALETYRANWRDFGRAGGPQRNQRMIDQGKPDYVVAFPGGRGTADMIRRAKKAGIEVHEITQEPPPNE